MFLPAMRGDEQNRHSAHFGDLRHAGAVAVAIESKVGEDEVEFLIFDHFTGGVEIVDGSHDFIAGFLEEMLIIERDEGLILDQEDTPYLSFAFAEEHVRGRPPIAVDLRA